MFGPYVPNPGLYWHDTTRAGGWLGSGEVPTVYETADEDLAIVQGDAEGCTCDNCEAFAKHFPSLGGRWDATRHNSERENRRFMESVQRWLACGLSLQEAYERAEQEVKDDA